MHNVISWCEIPAIDFDRAQHFYAAILGVSLEPIELDGVRMAMFPSDGENVSGAIVHGEDYVPSRQGSLIYLSGGDDLSLVLDRVVEAGGTVSVSKTLISPEFGYYALFIDSEGNRVGLHSPQ